MGNKGNTILKQQFILCKLIPNMIPRTSYILPGQKTRGGVLLFERVPQFE